MFFLKKTMKNKFLRSYTWCVMPHNVFKPTMSVFSFSMQYHLKNIQVLSLNIEASQGGNSFTSLIDQSLGLLRLGVSFTGSLCGFICSHYQFQRKTKHVSLALTG